ncbi:MAG: hypothetical protein U0350_47415 [Caldilineaceae bacterium]
MFFVAGVIVLGGGVLLTQKIKSHRQKHTPMIDHLVASPEPSASTAILVSPLAPKRLLPMDHVTVEQHLLLSGSTLGLRIISIAGAPFVGPVSLFGLLYLDLYFLRRAYVEWKTEGVDGVTDAVVATGLLVTRQFGADAIFATTYFISRKLIQQTERNLAQRLSCHPLPTQLIEANATHSGGEASAPLAVASATAEPEKQSSSLSSWQTVIRKGTLPFVTLSALTFPALGAKRSLAVLLTNFGYDYRVTAPLSTLTYMDLAAEHGVIINDWRAFEQLRQVDVIVMDEQLFANPMNDLALDKASDQPSTPRRLLSELHQAGQRACVLIRKDTATTLVSAAKPASPDRDELPPTLTTVALDEVLPLIQQLQADGRTVCLVSRTPLPAMDPPQANIVIALQDAKPALSSAEQLATAGAHILISTGRPDQLLTLFQLSDHLAQNLKRGFALTLLPSIVSLGGIYFFHFGAVRALLLESSALAAGVLNAQWPRLNTQSSQPTQRNLDEPMVETNA